MNSKKVGFIGLTTVALASFFTPSVASAHERCVYPRYYAPRVVRHEREIIRRREWRERHFDGRYYR